MNRHCDLKSFSEHCFSVLETENKTKVAVLSDAKEFSDAMTISYNGVDYTYYEGYGEGKDIIGYVFAVTVISTLGVIELKRKK